MKIYSSAFLFLLPFVIGSLGVSLVDTSTGLSVTTNPKGVNRTGTSTELTLTEAGDSKSRPAAPKSVKIGTQEWTTENLDVSTFRNGESIMEASTPDAWEKACISGTPAWCYYGNDKVKSKKYGKLYNFWAVMDKRKLAPEGWHVPSDAEWVTLAGALGGVEQAGKSLKSTSGWKSAANGDNKSGFSGLPAGYRSHEKPAYYGGPFFEAGAGAYWWSTTRYLVDNSFCRVLSYQNSGLEKSSFVLTAGLSVRLVRDGGQ